MISVECHVLLIWWILSLQFISISFHIISCLHLLSCVMRKLGHMVTPFHHGTSFCAVAWVRALAAKASAAAASLLEGGSTPRLATKKTRRSKRRKEKDEKRRKASEKRRPKRGEKSSEDVQRQLRLCRPPPARVSRHFGAPGPTCYDLPTVSETSHRHPTSHCMNLPLESGSTGFG